MHEDFFRWSLLAVLLLNLAISFRFRLQARRLTGTVPRAREGMGLVLLRLALVLPGLAILIGYLIEPSWEGWPRLPLPAGVRLLGLLVGLGCAALNVWVLKSLGSNVTETVLLKKTHQLVQEGPYRWVRHPLYTNGLLLVGSFVLLSASALLLLLAIALLIVFRTIIIPSEERHLISRFGQEYLDYQSSTGALLPRLRGRHKPQPR